MLNKAKDKARDALGGQPKGLENSKGSNLVEQTSLENINFQPIKSNIFEGSICSKPNIRTQVVEEERKINCQNIEEKKQSERKDSDGIEGNIDCIKFLSWPQRPNFIENCHFMEQDNPRSLKAAFQKQNEIFPVISEIQIPDALQFQGTMNVVDGRNSLYTRRKPYKEPVKNLMPSEPYMKLTMLRTSFDKNVTNEYFITPRGMINSSRNTEHDDIIIGRQQATPDGVIPNDICLVYTDRAISRIHCKIITKFGILIMTNQKKGFKIPREIPENFLQFLMMSHSRLGANSPGFLLPVEVYRHIYSFLKPERKFWLTDLGSVFGTYIRIKACLNYPLEKGQTYLVGADIYFNIMDMSQPIEKVPFFKEVIVKENYFHFTSEKKLNEDSEFMKFLLQEKLYSKAEIHGLSSEEQNILDNMVLNHNLHSAEENHETEINNPNFEKSYLKIEIQQAQAHIPPIHLFISDGYSEFGVGRMQESDIYLNQNTISRKQCRFICNEGLWYIADGNSSKESANGTWISLTDHRVKRERIESEPRQIEHGSEIKISDTILKVEIFNNH